MNDIFIIIIFFLNDHDIEFLNHGNAGHKLLNVCKILRIFTYNIITYLLVVP